MESSSTASLLQRLSPVDSEYLQIGQEMPQPGEIPYSLVNKKHISYVFNSAVKWLGYFTDETLKTQISHEHEDAQNVLGYQDLC